MTTIYDRCLQGFNGNPLRAATLQAAAFIARHPDVFNFHAVDVPHTCHTPGCILGWIHFFSKIKGIIGSYSGREFIEARRLFGVSDGEFYHRLDSIARKLGRPSWTNSNTASALVLQVYVDAYL